MRKCARFGCVVVGFTALAILKTYPLILHFDSRIPADSRDPLLIAWTLSWGVHALSTDPRRLFDANIFFPAEHTLAFSDHLLGVLPIFAPAYLLTGNPVAGYNALFVLSFAFSGLSAFCLAYYWTRAFWASIVGGALFGFAPYRFGQLAHLQLLNLFWAPWALLFLDRFLRSRRWRDLAAFALFYWLQVLSTLYLAFMITVAVGLFVCYHALTVDRAILRASFVAKALAFFAATPVVLLPAVLPYLTVNRRWSATRTIGGIVGNSADLLSYLTAPPLMNDLYLSLFTPTSPWPSSERALFPGLLLVALALLGSRGSVPGLQASDASRIRRSFGLIMAAAVVISLGPFLVAFGHKTRIPLPYLLFYYGVPGWAGMRVPARFAFLAVLAAIPIATLGVIRCCEAVSGWRESQRWSRRAPALVSTALIGALFVELGTRPVPLVDAPSPDNAPETYRWLAATRPGPIAELPMAPDDEYRYVFLSTVHWLPLVNGHSSFIPPTYPEIREALGGLPARRAVEYAAALGVKAVVVHTDKLTQRELMRWAAGGGGGGLRKVISFGPDVIYAVPPLPTARAISCAVSAPEWLPPGQRVRLGLLVSDGDARPWPHPAPQGESLAVVTWRDSETGRAVTSSRQVQFPPAIPPGETAAVPLSLTSPGRPGRYTIEVAIPGRALLAPPQAVEIRTATLGTSLETPDKLSAVYSRDGGAAALIVSAAEQVVLEITATNTGQAIWLAKATNDRGEVQLGWRWLAQDRELPELSGHAPLRYDVFPRQRYRFRLLLDSPPRPGRYVLELGFRSELVTSFEQVGTRPFRLVVRVAQRG